ncbi:MAG: DUF2316 family protein [Enterococcaceae bacterium]|jgi:hypothetical protein|nr:DUF2316 family protein [Enterococcaceae bacterium]MCI1918999.1 DUF2316 family protein [Enterococcaceae bacterium]
MSLNNDEKEASRKEFKENLAISGLTVEEIAKELSTTPDKIKKIMDLNVRALEDPWILKEYLEDKIRKAGKEPAPFTALAGNYHRHWFLNSQKIERGKF